VSQLPEVDSCLAPQAGAIEAIAIGPGGDAGFRALQFGERVEVVRGGQGLNMTRIRIRLTGPDVPACVKLKVGEVQRSSLTNAMTEVAVKTYLQPDGSRITKDYWQIVHYFPWTRLAVELADLHAAADVLDSDEGVLLAPGPDSYRDLEVRGVGVESLCAPEPGGPQWVAANPLDAVVAWRQGKLLGVLKPGLTVRTKPAGLTTCGTAELASVLPWERGPDDQTAAVGVGALIGVIGACSQPTQLPTACDGKGPEVMLQRGDQLDVLRGPLSADGRLQVRVSAVDGGTPMGLLESPGIVHHYLTVP
jgi:hypothetical protein